ncbi:diacylglycerol kinase [Trichonephila clavipes]|nr:diacylglycerol kinase [Trichonephila clavipes]
MASTGAKPNVRATENPSPTTEGPPEVVQQGHFFSKKTFHKPTYCHHCTDMLWGLIGQGLICEENQLKNIELLSFDATFKGFRKHC